VSRRLEPTAVVGVGYAPTALRGGPGKEQLTLQACRAALHDAGLHPEDVDGLFQSRFGPESPDTLTAARLLGIPDLTAYQDLETTGPSGLSGPMAAAMAVASGACEVALAYRCMSAEAGYHGGTSRGPTEITGREQFTAPYGNSTNKSILVSMAMRKQRRMAEYGTTQEHYGYLAVNARRWAAMNDRALFREPLTLEDYLASRIVVDPLLLLDCDRPVNGASAVVITSPARARDLRNTPVMIESLAYGTGRNPDWMFEDDQVFGATIDCARTLWRRSDLRPDGIDCAQLYDGFTHITLSWIEALGFCALGEYGDWVAGGKTIGPGGSLPLNTAGGHLGEGRLHGLTLLIEAVLQLRGQAGLRQVPGARTSVVANSYGPQVGAMTLTTA
jgi:acetyl-CoA acetyltransferase